MQKAAGLLQAGDVEAAEAELEAILEMAPNHGPANLLMGHARLDSGDLGAAQKHLLVATKSQVRRPYLAWYLLGRTLLAQGQPEQARESFDNAVENAPQFAPALVGRARTLIRLGDLDQAASDLERVQGLQGSGPDATLLLAEVLLALERRDEARVLLGPLTEAATDSTESLAARLILLSLGD